MHINNLDDWMLCSTGKALEKATAEHFKKQGYLALDLSKEKKKLPDFCMLKVKPIFVECKCYRSHKTLKSAVGAWKNKQVIQRKRLLSLDKLFPVYLLIQTRLATHFQRVSEL